jgi:hypothetical protein
LDALQRQCVGHGASQTTDPKDKLLLGRYLSLFTSEIVHDLAHYQDVDSSGYIQINDTQYYCPNTYLFEGVLECKQTDAKEDEHKGFC